MDDWIQAGYAILAAEGMKALKIDRLCSQLGVTKGSFSWHFDGMPSYLTAPVESWGELRDQDRRHIERHAVHSATGTAVGDDDLFVSPWHWTLERAMREWARSDESVAAGVRAAGRRLLRAVRQAFLAYGFDQEEADVRAAATFAAGVGLLHLSEARARTSSARLPGTRRSVDAGIEDPSDGDGVRWRTCPALR